MKKINATLIILTTIISAHTFGQQVISDLTSNTKEATGKLYDIYDLNVFKYFELDEYDTELKKVMFKKTEEYQNKLIELKSIRDGMLKTTYYAKLSQAFSRDGGVNYDMKRKGFAIEIGSDFAGYAENAKPPKSIYIQDEKESILLKALPTNIVIDKYYGQGKVEKFFISIDENDGLEIENGKENIEIYFFFTPSGKEKSTSQFSIVNPPGKYNITDNYLKSDKVRVVVVNKISGKIYFDQTYSYQSPPSTKKI